ncbi:hypothetical protein M1494_00605 [Candidatus Parvarchaeota archaeon]|nr:hypothetical protein [Candidatus Parvarchaeota archaeon]
MHLKEKVNGFANLLVIVFAVLFIALQTSLFVSTVQVKSSFRWLFKRILALKAEKA